MHKPTKYRALRRHAALLLGSLAIHLGLAAIAKAEEPTHNYAVAAQPLSGALTDFADQSNFKLMFPAELARGIASPGVTGPLTRDQALARLLVGTGLTYRYTSPDTVTIERPDPMKALMIEARKPLQLAEAPDKPQAPAKKSAESPTEQPEMTVTASPRDETSYNVFNATTATKTDTPIFDTPVSIQVVPQQVFRDQQAVTLNDIVENVSGVRPLPVAADLQTNYVIRGFENGGGSSIFRNGLFGIPRVQDTVNLERVEVLKGPASILYGRLEPGGLINLVTRQPSAEPSYALQQQFGSFDFYRTTAQATGPVTTDGSLRYGVDLAYENSESFRDFFFKDRVFFAPVLSWQLSARTELTLDFEYLDDSRGPDSGIPVLGNRPAPVPISRNLEDPALENDISSWLVGGRLTHAFTPDWKVALRFHVTQLDFFIQTLFPAQLSPTNTNIPGAQHFFWKDPPRSLRHESRCDRTLRYRPPGPQGLVGVRLFSRQG